MKSVVLILTAPVMLSGDKTEQTWNTGMYFWGVLLSVALIINFLKCTHLLYQLSLIYV